MRKGILLTVLLVFSGTMILAQPVESSGPQPEYMPYCYNPGQISPIQPAGGNIVYLRSSLAWNGREYAMVYVDYTDNILYFRRFFADGTPVSSAIPLGPAYYLSHPSISWSGTGYGVAWTAPEGAYRAAYFALLSPSGALLSGPTRVSFAGEPQSNWSYDVVVASSGTGFAAIWEDDRNYGVSGHDIYATLINSDGTIAGSGAYHDIVISAEANTQAAPAVVWSQLSQRYVIAYHSFQSGVHNEIYGAKLNPKDGTSASNGALASSGTTISATPHLAGGPAGLGLVWADSRDSNWEIYFQLLTPGGSPSGAALRLSNDSMSSTYPRIVWTGAEYGVFWADNRNGGYNTWFQRVTSSGTLPGGSLNNVQATFIAGNIYYPDAAFASYGYLVSFAPNDYGNDVMSFGCNGTSAPGCPTNLMAYGVSGSTATIAWQAALDNYNDIAYYSIYRNNAEIAKTSNTYYTDTGLGPNTTYNYTVRAVNAAQYMNDPNYCGTGQPQSVYVKTSASFTLMLDKSSDPNAHLYWSDGGMNSYNIFRGTNPQIMSLIGSTSGQSVDDANVLLDTNNYFYTVDDPGE